MPRLLDIATAARCLRVGQVIAYPTEAVYGLGCDPNCEPAVRRILHLKDRPESAGLILLAADFGQLKAYTGAFSAEQFAAASATWPGPLTWLFPRADNVPDWLAGGHATIALRVTAHPQSRELCQAFGGAIVSTSANPRGLQPALTTAEVDAYFGDRIAGIVAGELSGMELPSEIRDLASGAVIRPGG